MEQMERDSLLCVSEVLVKIRKLAQLSGDKTIAELAGAVHNTPRLIAEGNTAMRFLLVSERERAQELLR
jgi:hypothetical protein